MSVVIDDGRPGLDLAMVCLYAGRRRPHYDQTMDAAGSVGIILHARKAQTTQEPDNISGGSSLFRRIF